MPNPTAPWYLDENFWIKTESFVFGSRSDEDTEVEVELIINEIGAPPGRVLDLCCGMGRHSVVLASRGYQVTGVDASAHLLACARERAEVARVKVDWMLADARLFSSLDKFDAAICMYSSLGQFADEASDNDILRAMSSALTNSGIAIVDILGKEVLARVFISLDWLEDGNGRLLLRQRSIHDNWNRIENEWILVEDGRRTHFRMDQRLYDAKGLASAMASAGLSVEKVLGGFDGRPYDQTAQRLVAVARRNMNSTVVT